MEIMDAAEMRNTTMQSETLTRRTSPLRWTFLGSISQVDIKYIKQNNTFTHTQNTPPPNPLIPPRNDKNNNTVNGHMPSYPNIHMHIIKCYHNVIINMIRQMSWSTIDEWRQSERTVQVIPARWIFKLKGAICKNWPHVEFILLKHKGIISPE